MGNQARQVLEAALALPKDERAELAAKLLASVNAEAPVANSDMYSEYDPDPEVEKAWAAEIIRRVERIEAGQAVLVDGDEVHKRMLERFGPK